MKNFIISTITLIFLSLSCYAQKDDVKTKPNIIFLLTDDQRFDALGCMGNTEVKTPNIDKLANDGVIFMNNYNPTAICMGARAVIMTGMYEHKTGCNFQHGPLSRAKFEKSYPMLLKDAGYYTGFAGKFGYAVKDDPTASSNYHSNEDIPMDSFDWFKGWPGQGYYKTIENEFFTDYAEEYPHVTEALGAASVDFLKEAANQDKPFCFSLSFKAPHDPASPDSQYDNVFEGITFSKPENWGYEGSKHLPVQPKLGRQYQKLRDKYQEDKYNATIKKYYQLIYGIDVAVGMIIEELEAQNLMDNTVIIYTTDNGYFNGSHDFGGKVLVYEEGSRAPLIIYDPNSLLKGEQIESLTGTHDIAPTILEYAGLPIPENMDGVSLKPIMDGTTTKIKDHQMINNAWGVNTTQCLSVLKDDYKYIYWFYGGKGLNPMEELYNLNDDPQEMDNLARKESYKTILHEMRTLYDEYVEKWKNECTQIEQNNYIEYGILFDRNIVWEEKVDLLNSNREPDSLALVELLNAVDTMYLDTTPIDNTPLYIELEEEDVKIDIYPNPVNDYITVKLNYETKAALKIDLYELDGKLVSNLHTGTIHGAFNKSFQLDYKNGIYLVKVSINQTGSSKIIFINN